MWLNCVSINNGLVCLWWLKVDWSDTPDEPDWSNLTDECNGPKRLFRLEPKCPEIPRPSARSHWSNSSETSRKDSECAWCAWECHLDMGKWCWDSVTGWVGLVHVLWTIFCVFFFKWILYEPANERTESPCAKDQEKATLHKCSGKHMGMVLWHLVAQMYLREWLGVLVTCFWKLLFHPTLSTNIFSCFHVDLCYTKHFSKNVKCYIYNCICVYIFMGNSEIYIIWWQHHENKCRKVYKDSTTLMAAFWISGSPLWGKRRAMWRLWPRSTVARKLQCCLLHQGIGKGSLSLTRLSGTLTTGRTTLTRCDQWKGRGNMCWICCWFGLGWQAHVASYIYKSMWLLVSPSQCGSSANITSVSESKLIVARCFLFQAQVASLFSYYIAVVTASPLWL